MKEGKLQMKKLVLSDVDGTILKGSLVLNHACMLHDKKVVNLGNLPAEWLDDMKNESKISALANGYRVAIKGMTIKDLLVKEYMEDVLSSNDNFYSTIGRLETHRENGYDIHLVSGSPDYLLKEFANHYGFKQVGSKYHRNRRGVFTGGLKLMAGSDAKREYVSSLKLHEYSHITAYGDTVSDGPLFEFANHSVLVDPNLETESNLHSVIHEIVRN